METLRLFLLLSWLGMVFAGAAEKKASEEEAQPPLEFRIEWVKGTDRARLTLVNATEEGLILDSKMLPHPIISIGYRINKEVWGIGSIGSGPKRWPGGTLVLVVKGEELPDETIALQPGGEILMEYDLAAEVELLRKDFRKEQEAKAEKLPERAITILLFTFKKLLRSEIASDEAADVGTKSLRLKEPIPLEITTP